jgi:hypothetical protein
MGDKPNTGYTQQLRWLKRLLTRKLATKIKRGGSVDKNGNQVGT